MIEKIVSENIAGAKKKPMRVDWLEQISVRESRPGQETQTGTLGRGHYFLAIIYSFRSICVEAFDMYFYCS